ncbi:BatA domain-containing protein [Flexithrix dorotheae]|uniref:BatA domain-containing protein n=1 Tax=Flexithrix dorotheae TaxID=70993 RepID=UPI000371D8C1|nr:BatA domain-containing protein [Flexithrix dorotheae]
MNFIAPFFLYGLSLIAVPVIIHFFNFQRAKKVYFTNVAFLTSIKEITNSRNKLKNILVLLARILFITFLVLAFARPFIPNKNSAGLSRSNLVSIYFDNSYSLQNELDNKRLFDIGKNNIEQIKGVFSGNTRYQLIDNSFEGNVSFFYEGEKLSDKLLELDFSNAGRTLENVYARQLDGLRNNSSETGNHIFWISDFQKSSIGNLNEILTDTSNSYYLIPLIPNQSSNLYIDSVWLETPFIKEQENNILKVKIVNSGEEDIEGRVVKLFIDEKQVSSATINLEANARKEITMNFSVYDSGEKACKIELEDFPVNFDDEYFFTIKVAPKIKIINIANRGNNKIKDVYSSETFFEITQYEISSLDYSALNSADLIILENIDEIDNALLISLQRAYANGTSIVLFPSSQPDLESYTALVQYPITISESSLQNLNADSKMGLAPPSMEIPFFEGVFEKVSSSMSMPVANPYLEWPRVGTNLLKFKNESPFLTYFTQNDSKLYLFTTPLEEKFTDFSKHALFVPVMYKIALNSKVKNDRLAYSFNENIASISIDSVNKNDIFKLVNGDFELIPSQQIAGNNLMLNVPKNNLESGTYAIENSKTKRNGGLIAFNYDKSESQLEYYSAEDLQTIFGESQNVQIFSAPDEDEFAKEFSTKNISTPLWRYALLLALFFLFVEILLIRFWKDA